MVAAEKAVPACCHLQVRHCCKGRHPAFSGLRHAKGQACCYQLARRPTQAQVGLPGTPRKHQWNEHYPRGAEQPAAEPPGSPGAAGTHLALLVRSGFVPGKDSRTFSFQRLHPAPMVAEDASFMH